MCTPLSQPFPPAPTVYLSPIIYYYYICAPLIRRRRRLQKKILDKNDEKFLVVVMCVVNKLTHLPALPVSSHTG